MRAGGEDHDQHDEHSEEHGPEHRQREEIMANSTARRTQIKITSINTGNCTQHWSLISDKKEDDLNLAKSEEDAKIMKIVVST